MPKCGFEECRRRASGDGLLPWACEECAQKLAPEIEQVADKFQKSKEDDIRKN